MAMLKLDNIQTYYGESHILQGVSLEISEKEIVTLLGRNGAGKTTTLRSIMGFTPPRFGKIIYKGEDVTGKKPHEMFHKGIGHAPQGRRIFTSLMLIENLNLGARKQSSWTVEKIMDLFPPLKGRESHRGNELSGGEQQMLAIGRALMGGPNLILLDEPSEGLAPLIVKTLMDVIRRLKDEGLTILLVEQNIEMALELGDRHYIIDQGIITHQANSREFLEDENIKTQYLTI